MRTANSTKPKTDFGIEVGVFCMQTGMNKKQVAGESSAWWERRTGEADAVKYSSLVETCTGRSAGHKLIPIVRAFMQDYAGGRAGA